MKLLDDFAAFISRKTGIRNLDLIKRDVLLHAILYDIYSGDLGDILLFKGGSCLIKCYLGYYRFSVDLDFTFSRQDLFKGKTRKEIRRIILRDLLPTIVKDIAKISSKYNLTFKPELSDREFFEFERNSRLVIIKLYHDESLIKIQINFTEDLIYREKSIDANTLLMDVAISKDERVYFGDFLTFYRPIKVRAYDPREIAAEKIRAILTRRGLKIADVIDLFALYKKGLIQLDEKLRRDAVRKVLFGVRESRRYLKNLMRWRPIQPSGLKLPQTLIKPINISELRIFLYDLNAFLENTRDHIKTENSKNQNTKP